MTCKFDPEKCSPDCRNFSFCSYIKLQQQMNSLQEQLNTLFSVMTDTVKTTANLQEKLNVYTRDMLELISEIENKKERHIEENEN